MTIVLTRSGALFYNTVPESVGALSEQSEKKVRVYSDYVNVS